MLNLKNLEFLRSRDPRLGETLEQLQNHINRLGLAAGVDGTGLLPAPARIGAVSVTGQNGHFSVAIMDKSPVTRAINYFIEHDTDPNFTNPTVIHNGTSRNANIFLGNAILHFRAYSMYQGSTNASEPVTFGTPAVPVNGGGAVGAPAFQTSQGSGTASGEQGGQGFGTKLSQ